MIETLDPVVLLSRDLRKAAATLSPREARYLVDYYYTQQENRKAADNQVRQMQEEPHEVLAWLAENTRTLEKQIVAALGRFSKASPVGQWAESQVGIGPVISAGLLAHIDIEKAPTAGHIWNFAGLNPGVEWKKGEKRPWNASLKVLCWKIGESFVKVSGNPNAYYGLLYVQRKALEEANNAKGLMKDQAAAKLERFKIGKTTEAYKAYSAGILPPAHVHARAKRWVVKLFLSHWQAVAYEVRYGKEPPAPYAIAYLGHADWLKPPGWPM